MKNRILILFALVISGTAAADSFLSAQQFPKTFDDLSFKAKQEFKTEDYDRYANLTAYEQLVLESVDKNLEEQIEEDMSNLEQIETTNIETISINTSNSGQYCGLKNPGIPENQKIPFGSPVLHEHFIFCAPYGMVNRGKGSRRHTGYDIGCSKPGHESFGDPVFTTADGVVSAVVPNRKGGTAGNYIVIDHENGFQTWYMHLNEIFVHKGQRVSSGCQIGTIGNTGASLETRSNDPNPHFAKKLAHVHYEMKYKGSLQSVTTETTGQRVLVTHGWSNHASIDPTQFICVYAHFKTGYCGKTYPYQ